MATMPAASAARNGFPGDADALNAAEQIQQCLGTHHTGVIYQGAQTLTPPDVSSGVETFFYWINSTNVAPPLDAGLLEYDLDQPFTMPTGQTAIGRIELAMLPIGDGADIQVTLYPDNGSGAPNTASPLASTVVPAAWTTNLAAPDGLAAAGPLAVASYNTLLTGTETVTKWTQPAVGPNGAASYATPVTSGDYLILMGGSAGGGSSTAYPNVATVQYLGNGTLSGPVPQPSLPQGAYYSMGCATDSMVMFAGGIGGGIALSAAFTAPWNPNTGSVGAWTQQTALPVALIQGSAAAWGDYVYVIGGSTSISASDAQSTVYYASAVNGQIQVWMTGPPLPQPLQCTFAGVVGDWLIVAGGQTAADVTSGAVYYAPINSDGSLGGWRVGPSLSQPVYALTSGWNVATTDTSLIIHSGLISGGVVSNATQIITASPAGLGSWQYQWLISQTYQACAFPNGTAGGWDLFAVEGNTYVSSPMTPVPLISVPLAATGLTPGNSYHLVVHQIGGDINNYIEVGELTTSNSWLYSTRGGGGPWSVHAYHSLMLNIYDQTSTGQPIHTWTDPNSANFASAASTIVWDADGNLLGCAEATAFVTQAGGDPAFLPSVAVLGYGPSGGMPTSITQLA